MENLGNPVILHLRFHESVKWIWNSPRAGWYSNGSWEPTDTYGKTDQRWEGLVVRQTAQMDHSPKNRIVGLVGQEPLRWCWLIGLGKSEKLATRLVFFGWNIHFPRVPLAQLRHPRLKTAGFTKPKGLAAVARHGGVTGGPDGYGNPPLYMGKSIYIYIYIWIINFKGPWASIDRIMIDSSAEGT